MTLTESTLFSLVRNSPLLGEIKMEYTNIGRMNIVKFNSFRDSVVRPPLKSLHLACIYGLRVNTQNVCFHFTQFRGAWFDGLL